MAREIRRLTETLALLNRGRFAEELDRQLGELIGTMEALPSEEGRATMTITLDFAFQGGLFNVKPKVKSKLPDDQVFSATPFWASGGALSVEHPSQQDMFTREAPKAAERERETA